MRRKKRKRDTFPDFLRRIIRFYLKDLVLIFAGIIMVGAAAFAVSGYRTGNRGRVYAVSAKSGQNGYQKDFLAGLTGVVNGVADMEDYSRNVQLYHVMDDGSKVLAGLDGISKLLFWQEMMKQDSKEISKVGYYASQMVEASHISKEDYNTLLRLVEAEATGGDVKSKMIVAGVVMNRVADARFPNTISDVIWQKMGGVAQFQPTQDGRIYNCTVTESTVEAVDRVLAGEDCSQGALFFLARTSSEASSAAWFDNALVKLFEYGGHEYYTFAE